MNQYQIYKKAIQGYSLPSACLDLDLLDKNIEALNKRAQGVPIRIASKSIRSVPVLKYLSERIVNYSGLMTFSLEEACFLSDQGLDNILMGYPSLQKSHLKEIGQRIKSGKRITLMVDKLEHLEVLSRIAQEEDYVFPVCIDVDVSTKFPGIYFGVYRSSIKTLEEFKDLLESIVENKHLVPAGFMGYEAQIAGVTDNQKGKGAINTIVKSLKKKSIPKIAEKRKECNRIFIEVYGSAPEIVNAGGTGSIESSIKEDWVNEITIGSGFFQPSLFDNYSKFKHEPAAFYALEIVRNPSIGIYTAHGGGYIASGSCGEDKVPSPYLPKGMRLEKNEGAGEVQTPVYYNGDLQLGDPVFFRHAKAGELCERFNTIQAIRDGKVIEDFSTYRGQGKSFL